ncbi:dihydroorotase [Methylacidimicrobium cyclopophantes]|uniref:Dihydroorotase n=1 Tax=Methylacidimicrobium cyclopophantes TaxID=1041766 RepID=A0A5E6MKB4_9BACT|nr:dihydroorotase [Methylacidimicrobium cyclopophantes]VVM08427.1 dihydroorotase [Methylacidimicrobium cyclopophantes]
MSGFYRLAGGRIVDPSCGRDEIGDLFVAAGRIADPASLPQESWERIDASGCIVAPGLIDLHVHLREPGDPQKETIASGTRAAAAGGFTAVVAMPNTRPPADQPNTIGWIRERAKEQGAVRVYPTGCLSEGRKGEKLAPLGSLRAAGVVAFTDDGGCIQDAGLMRRVMEYAAMLGLPILEHCEETSVSGGGTMHEGYWSTVLGLRGWPSLAEELIVSRDILLAELTGARLHCQHLSTAGSVRLVREAKRRGVAVSAEVTPHHLALTDGALVDYDTNFKMNPPLGSEADREALLEGIADGTIDLIASDHAPHCSFEKEVEFDRAPFGVVGLETMLAVSADALVKTKILDWPALIQRLSTVPARILGLPGGTLTAGAPADLVVIDPNLEWIVDPQAFLSRGRNSPFAGWELRGRAILTMVEGKIVWRL